MNRIVVCLIILATTLFIVPHRASADAVIEVEVSSIVSSNVFTRGLVNCVLDPKDLVWTNLLFAGTSPGFGAIIVTIELFDANGKFVGVARGNSDASTQMKLTRVATAAQESCVIPFGNRSQLFCKVSPDNFSNAELIYTFRGQIEGASAGYREKGTSTLGDRALVCDGLGMAEFVVPIIVQ